MHVQYLNLSSCTISEEINDPIFRKFSETDRQVDRQTDEKDFIGRCPTNFERSIKINIIKTKMIKTVLTTDQIREPLSTIIVLVQVYSGLDRVQFIFVFWSKIKFS